MRTKSKTILFGIAGILIIGIIISINSDTKETQPQNELVKAMNFLKNHAGNDKTGSTILETIVQTISQDGETLTEQPTWEAREPESFSTVYPVTGKFKTSNGEREYSFTVDLRSETVSATNDLASNILKLIN